MSKSLIRLAVIALLFLILPLSLVGANRRNVPSGEGEGIKSNVLVLGRDSSSGLYDGIMLVTFDGQRATVIQIPRDMYINLGEGSYKKINGASKILGGEAALCKKLSEAFSVDIDGYISFDTKMVEKVVNALGGVSVKVPMDMNYDDPYQDLSIHIKKGERKLDGKEAVEFLRYRSGYLRADIGRMDAQKIFMSSFLKTLSKAGNDKFNLKMLGLAARYIKTDLSVSWLFKLVDSVRALPEENVLFTTLPGEEVRSELSGAWFYILSKSGCAELFDIDSFDGEMLFSDAGRREFFEIYNKEIKAHLYSVAEIDNNGIEIVPK